jgi:malate synthase
MAERLVRHGLSVDSTLVEFVESELVRGATVVSADVIWSALARLVRDFGDRNRALIGERERIQHDLDSWHQRHPGPVVDMDGYRNFLADIGYLVDEGESFTIDTSRVDREITTICGPQLVVPVMNARYALNAVNARHGSLYDALYGTDAIGTSAPMGPYDSRRGSAVVTWVRNFFDSVVPLQDHSHTDVDRYVVAGGRVLAQVGAESVGFLDESVFVGFTGDRSSPDSILLAHHDLHVEIVFDDSTAVGAADRAGISDVILESAVTAIMDFEDSVAAVDAEDKVSVYRNWLGLMRRNLETTVEKGPASFVRKISGDKIFLDPNGNSVKVRGTALMLARNVGHLMTTSSVLDESGNEIFEGALDLVMTTACALHDLQRDPVDRNSPEGSVYVVKPKMHGPREVQLAVDMMASVEESLGLAPNTIKIGIMDEERRTSVNLGECIRVARHRVVFINTGFLDRTGDEIHTSMEAGPMLPKGDMKSQPWLKAYEERNVLIGLACGFMGRAQIGKGMWAAPDLMADMLDQKIAHPRSGANCAWVPSPTAATLHATHYHQVDVRARQRELVGSPIGDLTAILTIPVGDPSNLSREQRMREVDNSCQSILGYVVRWVDQGVGCSKVPDINDVALMEDRATCRISSQHVANWVRHGVVEWADVEDSLRRMALVVDSQNSGDDLYESMAPAYSGEAFAAALDLVRSGCEQPSGYTEPILHARRIRRKKRR